MRPRHAAALAFVGWYLMMPPLAVTQKQWERFINMPLSNWDIAQSFDTAKECEAERKTRRDEVPRIPGKIVPLVLRPSLMVQCIATDDPRLKPK